jgi:hypothetical protein
LPHIGALQQLPVAREDHAPLLVRDAPDGRVIHGLVMQCVETEQAQLARQCAEMRIGEEGGKGIERLLDSPREDVDRVLLPQMRCSVAGTPLTTTCPTSVCGTPSASMAFLRLAARAGWCSKSRPRSPGARKGASRSSKRKRGKA